MNVTNSVKLVETNGGWPTANSYKTQPKALIEVNVNL